MLIRLHRPILPRWLDVRAGIVAATFASTIGFVCGYYVAGIVDPPPRVFVAPCPELAE